MGGGSQLFEKVEKLNKDEIKQEDFNIDFYIFHTDKESIANKIALHNELKKTFRTHSQASDYVLACFVPPSKSEFRFSMMSLLWNKTTNKSEFSSLRRNSFVLGENIPCATAKEQFREFFNKPKTKEAINEAFSLEPVTNEFFNNYKKQYDCIRKKLLDIKARLNGYAGIYDSTKAVSAFSKKLLGRIVFLYFLQKKGWLGVARDSAYGSGDKRFLDSLFAKAEDSNKSFYIDYLCPLFFESLNKEGEEEGYREAFNSKIPFLNGGLFEEIFSKDKNSYDRSLEVEQILSNDIFKNILDFFNQYNFTLEESTPDEVEISIDPEMLGKVFENLIDYNKDTGAFYTPREVVHYMCKNTLLYSLNNTFPDNHNELYNLIFLKESDNDFISKNGNAIKSTLLNLKILDPAIGSGAFPMGMLSEILSILKTLDKTLDSKRMAELKRDIVSKQIYGLDIDSDAIDIARLRFWLSIAVDEEAPSPLPNLDFKFMQGNSLLERLRDIEILPSDIDNYKDMNVDLFGNRDSKDNLFDKSLLDSLSDLFYEYYSTNKHETKKRIKDSIISKMERAFDMKIKEIDECIVSEEKALSPNPRLRAKQQEAILNHENFKADLEQLLNDYKNNDFHTDKLFLYKLFFADIFKNGGFDIVIGNPPYIRQEDISSKDLILREFDAFKISPNSTSVKFSDAGADIYTYFYAKGLQILKNRGILSYITSNKWCRAKYGKNLRSLILENSLLSHYDLNGIKVFDTATVDTAITTISKIPPQEEYKIDSILLAKYLKKIKINNTYKHDLSEMPNAIKKNSVSIPLYALNNDSFIFPSKEVLELKQKIESIGTPLKDWDINIYRGILTGYNEAFIINSEKREEILNACKDDDERARTEEIIKPILRGRDIKRYSYEWAGLWIIGTFPALRLDIEDYPAIKNYLASFGRRLEQSGEKNIDGIKGNNARKKTTNKWFETQDNIAYYQEFAKPKIVWNPVSGEYFFSYIKEAMYFNNSLFMMTHEQNKEDFLLSILGLMNSTLYKWLVTQMTNLIETGKYAYGAKDKIETLPIPKITKKQEEEFIKIVREIIDSKAKSKDSKELESSLDSMVYQIYNINNDDIKIVESALNRGGQ